MLKEAIKQYEMAKANKTAALDQLLEIGLACTFGENGYIRMDIYNDAPLFIIITENDEVHLTYAEIVGLRDALCGALL